MWGPPPDMRGPPPGQQLITTQVEVDVAGARVLRPVTIAVPIGSQIVGAPGIPSGPPSRAHPPHPLQQPPPPRSSAPRAPYGPRGSTAPRGGYADEGLRGFGGGGSNKRPYGSDLRGEGRDAGGYGGRERDSGRDSSRGGDRESKRARPSGGGRQDRGGGREPQRGGGGQEKAPRPEPALPPHLAEPVSEEEVLRVRSLVVEQMQALLDNCKEKGETPAPEVHGFLLSRVKEMYLSRHKVELDHRRYGCSKMRDIVPLLFADLAKVECTPQKATVLMPHEGKNYKDVEAAAGGEGLKVGGA
ncbi:hypothetical protein DUNSADRAFT_6250 [Dunaliella salina]|uniref:HTH OST-type domain-containing protein n=1 Tax=Dunaliella salina TaxID=3046 RepID=A0ABQ7GNT0_DUNSA|nr:hypothetical protein DUNSADRAFT_6250 [Dunaliella salina]|eukprot:KAF5836238.1 hypothetical protein DUNSADRAFT_6250 [Dunaliella salina]